MGKPSPPPFLSKLSTTTLSPPPFSLDNPRKGNPGLDYLPLENKIIKLFRIQLPRFAENFITKV
jgi:hypothetical protein